MGFGDGGPLHCCRRGREDVRDAARLDVGGLRLAALPGGRRQRHQRRGEESPGRAAGGPDQRRPRAHLPGDPPQRPPPERRPRRAAGAQGVVGGLPVTTAVGCRLQSNSGASSPRLPGLRLLRPSEARRPTSARSRS
ncbi:hypothetical protein ONE63_007869 [Megalurothrips usitatus]|uniref:Uncharacterized protein n=1 Tax=Megalurothrips usitatus TaxID=439358 RepID=A0AAV7XSD3_9NEOP|nr:hypothetical protein ONE63_007869 [Megalurothrips usitatus]